MMENLLKDLRYGIRMLMKRPGITAIAVLALALGIGANSAIFTVVNAVLLRSLPFKDPDRLVIVHETVRRASIERRPASYPDYSDWRDQNTVFEEIAAFDSTAFTLTNGEDPERVQGEWASANYFPLLGVAPAMGRPFLAEEDRSQAARPVVVLSHSLWQRRFGSDPNVVGKNIKLNDEDYTVVGIMPEGFQGVTDGAQMWVPITMYDSGRPDRSIQERGSRWHQVIARLKTGVSLEQAQSEMDSIASGIQQAHPNTNRERGVLLVAAHEDTVASFRPTLLVLLAAVGFVLFIACANVANLLLARAAARQKEIAIRTAMGASRRRVIRQLLTESVLLGLAGGALGLLFAVWGVDLLLAVNPVQVPSFVQPKLDARVLSFTLLVSLLTGMLFGLAPALQASKPDLNEALKEGSRGSTGGYRHNRIRHLLIVSEVALALVLLVGAGLMIQSFRQLQSFDPGFKTQDIVSARISLPQRRYSAAQSAQFGNRVIERLEALPSIQSTSLASDVPLDGNSSATTIELEGRADPQATVRVYTHSVSEKFFDTLSIPLISGRAFTPQDTAQAPGVVIISDSMARRFFSNEDPLGKRINVGGTGVDAQWLSIVGVVGDVKYRTLIRDRNKDPDIYFPILQNSSLGFAVVVRTTADAASATSMLRRELQALDATLPLHSVTTLAQLMTDQTAQSRFTALVLGAFSLLAIVLASVGIYGVVSYSVTQRTHEIGIRVALGAQGSDILRMVVSEGMKLVMVGVGAGLAGSIVLTRLIASQLYGVSPTDPLTFASVSLLLAAVALLASYVPARRAARVDPMIALRHE